MKKVDFIKAVAAESGIEESKVNKVYNSIKSVISKTLASGEDVSLTGFLTLSTKVRAERKGVNLKTKETITIPAKKVVKVKVGKELSESI